MATELKPGMRVVVVNDDGGSFGGKVREIEGHVAWITPADKALRDWWPKGYTIGRAHWGTLVFEATSPLLADRVTKWAAQRAFEKGATILVSERGDQLTHTVHKDTTVHTRETTTWAELVRQVDMWRNRHPNQRYYIVRDF